MLCRFNSNIYSLFVSKEFIQILIPVPVSKGALA